ncbi:MAG: DUF559 domain-containing protein [Bacillota bacterium]
MGSVMFWAFCTRSLGSRRGTADFPLPPASLPRCRELRQRATDAEQLLWGLLRDRQFCGAKFRRQYPSVLSFWIFMAMKPSWPLSWTAASQASGGSPPRCRADEGFGD